MMQNNFISKARSSRTIIESLKSDQVFFQSLFIGFYNGEPYLDSIEKDLAAQNLTNLKIIVADNASEDSTWEKLQIWRQKFPGQIVLVRNPINVGAAGNLALNIDLFEGKWFAAFHQDDSYEPAHIEVLGAEFRNDEVLACVFTEMGSMNQDGIKVIPPVRPIWFLQDKSETSLFLGNIHTHLISWPSAGFDKEKFSTHITPWHSAAFADTEIALKLSLNSRIKHLNTITMHYMENPESESHSLFNPEKYVGAALGLIRIFAGIEFNEFVKTLKESDRAEFSSKLDKSIYSRLGNGGLANFVALFAQEKLNEIWEYSEATTLYSLSKHYQDLEGQRTADLLSEIAAFIEQKGEGHLNRSADFNFIKNDKKLEWQSLFSEPNSESSNRGKIGKSIRILVKKMIGFLPSRYQTKFKIHLMKIMIKISPSHPWNFK